ncbi:MAG: tRNA (adenosine(37)-N6)-threonylcarbamoyltransferase complex ATPase subunit type 1 TsaE [Planctomycetota bacterium]
MSAAAENGAARGSAVLDGAEATHAVGLALGQTLPAGACLALEGDLGTGKTTLVRGLAEGLGIDGVSSPTYVLMQAHPGGRLPLYHFDAWMEGREKALLAGGGDEDLARADGIAVVEWASRVEEWLPLPRLRVTLEHRTLESRGLRLELLTTPGEASDPLAAGLLASLQDALRAAGSPPDSPGRP